MERASTHSIFYKVKGNWFQGATVPSTIYGTNSHDSSNPKLGLGFGFSFIFFNICRLDHFVTFKIVKNSGSWHLAAVAQWVGL